VLDASKSIWAPKIAYTVEGLREGINQGLDHNIVPDYIESHCANAVQCIYEDTEK
jgi:hypothetical protein